MGEDIESAIFNLRKSELWPIPVKLEYYSEHDLFDIIESLHDHCSEPTNKEYHSWNDCGWHVLESDDEKGKEAFRSALNSIIKDYKTGFEISPKGEILHIPENGLRTLLQAEIVTSDEDNIRKRIEAAIGKFRKAKTSEDQRRDAIRDLADVLEYLRPKVKSLLHKQDEGDLFNIANNFGIRHHNQQQKTDYDKPLWHSWIF